MTQTSEVTVSDAEVDAFATLADLDVTPPFNEDIRAALAAFLARRVPDARPYKDGEVTLSHACNNDGHNACRNAVLKGEG